MRVRRFALAATIAAATFAATVPAARAAGGTALAAYWKLDSVSGTAVNDSSGNELTGTLGGSPLPAAIAGRFQGALSFAGGYVDVASAPALAPAGGLTVETWVRAPESPGTFRYLVGKGAEACIASSYGLYTGASGGVAFYAYDGTQFAVSASAVPSAVWDGAWHHVAGVYDGTNVRLFLDGVELSSGGALTAPIDYTVEIDRLWLGQYPGVSACGTSLHYTGALDEVRIWGRALANDEIGASAAMGAGSGDEISVTASATEVVVFASHFSDKSRITFGLESSSGARTISGVAIDQVRFGTAPALVVDGYDHGGKSARIRLVGGTAKTVKLRVVLDNGSRLGVNVATAP